MNDTQFRLGSIIEGEAERDAVHIAVIPLVAAGTLHPGSNFGITEDGRAVGSPRQSSFGIVDPFLDRIVSEGERFWGFLYPNTITGMRHVWEHTKLDASLNRALISESEKWLRNFVEVMDCPNYDRLIAAASDEPCVDGDDYYYYSKDGDYLHFGGSDAHGEIPAEFWHHVEVVTGKHISHRPTYFSCSC